MTLPFKSCKGRPEKFRTELEKEVKAALKSLEATSKFLEQTGELAKVGGWELDLKSGRVHMTRQTQILHEIDSNYLPPQYSTGGEWYPPEAWPTVQSAVKAAIQEGKPYDLESPFITAKGRRIWVRVQGFPVKEEERVTAIRGTFQDITERKKTEEEIAKMNLQLIHSSKLASLGEMSAGIAHEINNPLAIISGTVCVLSKFAAQPEKWVKVELFDDPASVVLRVIDSGSGIPENVRSKLFEPFFTTKKVGEGTGLGLSITKGILDEHKATITVRADSPNTCFEIRFPRAEEMKNAA